MTESTPQPGLSPGDLGFDDRAAEITREIQAAQELIRQHANQADPWLAQPAEPPF